MKIRQLGNSDMDITRIGLGAWAIGGDSWGPQDDKDSIETIHKALDAGMNWIDTAAIYGQGHSETVVGQALKSTSHQPYVFTKCSLIWDEDGNVDRSLKADSLRREVEASLSRLQIDVIDLYQIHWPNPDAEIEEGWETLAKLKEEGKVRYIGVSNFSVAQMERAMAIAPITSLQPPYSAVRPDVAEEILPFCGSNNIGTIVYSPMQAGLLTGKMTRERLENMPEGDWRKNNAEFQEPKLSKNLAIADTMVEIAQKHDVPTPAIAIAWVLSNPNVTAAIVGARRPSQIDGIIGGSDVELDEDDLAAIEEAMG
ncbi:aldo/keto reductase [Phototrophicus methaneseepsis]|uniref:Aldo/keto reductase n=1 Tax=Phototrophicus methaneseepsis TaxID=2710758 RepID=A0A7S8ECE3_9CHLR|nr:aldo/keto reductase [Phototrophicus methaneseepsis]QPC84289.1 aldo/keto reductase [Phototrophicus methaneseepsis]